MISHKALMDYTKHGKNTMNSFITSLSAIPIFADNARICVNYPTQKHQSFIKMNANLKDKLGSRSRII